MKCCSLKIRDLDVHFQNMSKHFYQLGGTMNPDLKQAFLASIPEILSSRMFLILQQMNQKVGEVPLGHLYQIMKQAHSQLCEQRKVIKMYLGSKKNPFGNLYCDKPDLQIKCKDSSLCKCSGNKKKKKHFFKIKGRKLNEKSKQ